jgi:hypothetical protein
MSSSALSDSGEKACVMGMFNWWITLRMGHSLGGEGAAHGCPKS